MKQKISTLEGMIRSLSPYRQKGNATKLIDNAVQIIFSGQICVVEDDFEMGKNERANRLLFNRILDRFKNEHPQIKLLAGKKNLIISLENPLEGTNILDGVNTESINTRGPL